MSFISNHDILYWHDFVLAPIYAYILILITKRFIVGKYANTPIQKYIMPALYIRILGCVLSAFMYQYYYGGGDTFEYSDVSMAIGRIFWRHPSEGLDIIFSPTTSLTPTQWEYLKADSSHWMFREENNAMVCRIGGFLSIFTFSSYLSIGLIMTFFSFLGCWKMFLVFYDLYPKIHKHLAIATLFIPSVFFWGAAGLMKDTVVMAALGYLTHGAYMLFIKRRKIFTSLIQTILSFGLVYIVKLYVVVAFIPALAVWVFLTYESKIKITVIRLFAKPAFFAAGIFLSIFAFGKISEGSKRYSQKDVLKYAMAMQGYHKQRSQINDGSGYDLGDIDPTPSGVLKTAPKAINVTLFRPYIWEIKKPILVPSALEAIFFLFFTIYIFLKTGIWATLKNLFSDPNVLFCLIFSLIFAFAVGFSSYNFGALARYKIPCIPFYFLALFIMYNKKLKNT